MIQPDYLRAWRAKLRPLLWLTIQERPDGFSWVLTPRAGESKRGHGASFEEAEAEALEAAETMPIRRSRFVSERMEAED